MKKIAFLLLIISSLSGSTQQRKWTEQDLAFNNIRGKWDSLRENGFIYIFQRDKLLVTMFRNDMNGPPGKGMSFVVQAGTYDIPAKRLILKADNGQHEFRFILWKDVLYVNAVNDPQQTWWTYVKCPPAPCDFRQNPIPEAAYKAIGDAKPMFDKYADWVLKNE